MSDAPERRLKFYGTGDYATYWQIEEAFRLLGNGIATAAAITVNDIVQLYNAAEFASIKLYPQTATDDQRAVCDDSAVAFRKAVGRFFSTLDDSNIGEKIVDVDFQYRSDVLALMSRTKVFDRCSGPVLLEVLRADRFHLSDLLACRALVRAYDADVRELIRSDPRHAEQLAAKLLQSESTADVTLPKSLTPTDYRALFDAYLDLDDANPNFVNLIALARADKNTGIDVRLKLKAKRKYDASNAKFFEENEGIRSGVEVRISDSQSAAVTTELDGLVGKYVYGQAWLSENLDYATVLNNFIYLFEFSNRHMLLELPATASSLGVMERLMMSEGREAYRTGAAFNHTDMASLLQTVMYDNFLRDHGIELEEVIAWFFAQYLLDEFGAANLKFKASSITASYLERSRHLFAEMESVLKQYSLYVEDGELDLELLSMSSETLSYHGLPTMLPGKYASTTEHSDITHIQHLLFSDQSHLTYISEDLKAEDFVRLVQDNSVRYEDFHEYQQREIDWLSGVGIVNRASGGVEFTSKAQVSILRNINHNEAASYYHYGPAGRASIDAMVDLGWLRRGGGLLTTAESSYFNYFLNSSQFANGPDLRNRYLHGQQADGDDNSLHRQTYFIALRMLIALLVKINDDFCLADQEGLS